MAISKLEQTGGAKLRLTLDKSRIPREMWDDPRLLEAETQIALAMHEPTRRYSFCIHEAAHGVHAMRAGAKMLQYFGPMVKSYGGLVIEFERGEIQLAEGQMTTIPRGLRHPTRPVGRRSVNLTFEAANSETTI